MKMKTLSLVAALALATTAVHADTAPFYLISSSTYNPLQSPPFQPIPVPSLSYSSIKGILAHSTGTTKNQPALDIQEWENNQFFWTQKSETVAKTVVAINVLGMDANVGNAYLAGSSPSYNVEGAPTSAEVLKATMSNLATELGNSLGSQVKQQTFETGSFNLAVESEIKATLPQPGSVANVLNSFQKRFNEMTFDANDAVDAAFIVEVEFVAKLFDNIADFHGTSMKSTFAGLVMSGVQKIATHRGRDSDKYKAACGVIWDLMEKIVVPKSIDAFGEGATIAILFNPPTTSHHSKRALVSLPILYGLGNFEQCAAKDSAGCTTITNSCNGRGACVQKKTDCWVCKCTTAVDSAFKGSTSPAHWSGNACQFKDTVAEFWLLWGTGIALLAVVFGVTMFLVSMGGSMDSGPMVAMSGGAPGIKVD